MYSLGGVTYAGDGDLLASTDSANGTYSFAMNDLNQLTQACNPGCTSWSYDRYGNRWGGPKSLTFNGGATNRVDGWSYDASGNLLNDGYSYTYDAEGRVTAVNGGSVASYVYDAEGRRVHENVGGVVQEYVYAPWGQELTVVNANQNLLQGETYFGARQLGTQSPGAFTWTHQDELGTVRAQTNTAGSLAAAYGSGAWGENLSAVGALSNLHFTGQYRDGETGLDNFGARYYASSLGSFVTPDWSAAPELAPYADLAQPQSLNPYSYVLNNPATATDPNGHWCIFGRIGTTCGGNPKPPLVGGGAAAGSDALAELGDFVGELGGTAVAVAGSAALVVLATVNQAGSGTDPASVNYRKGRQPAPVADIKAPGRPTEADGYFPPKRGAGADGQMVKNPNGAGRGYLDKDGNVWVPTGEGPTAHGGPHWDVQSPRGGYHNVYPGGSVRQGSGGGE